MWSTYHPEFREYCNLAWDRLCAPIRHRAAASRSTKPMVDRRRPPVSIRSFEINSVIIDLNEIFCLWQPTNWLIDLVLSSLLLIFSIKMFQSLIRSRLLTFISLSLISHENIPGFSFFMSSIRFSISGVATELRILLIKPDFDSIKIVYLSVYYHRSPPALCCPSLDIDWGFSRRSREKLEAVEKWRKVERRLPPAQQFLI